ncbi:MAG: type II toxin-antitoxin system HicB family antitoxin [Methylovulum sp.]|nr:type II toxin-antitoxin system HicB family antitoxin [Methylovulum sp.]
MFSYPVTLEKDTNTGQVIVDFVDIPFAHSVGDDEDEALLNAVDALETAFESLMGSRLAIPTASPINSRPCVTVPVLIAGKAALYNAMLESGSRKADLARKLNISPSLVDRLLSIRHKSRIEQIESALAIFGRRLLVEVQ